MSTWWQYVSRVSHGAEQKSIAAVVEIDQSSVSRWKREGKAPSAETVIKFARAYGEPVVTALIVAGHLDQADLDADEPADRPTVAEMTADELLREIRRRIPEEVDDDVGIFLGEFDATRHGLNQPYKGA